MQINLTPKEFRRLLDLVYIGNWVLNSTRGEDRFADYDNLESKLFALSPALSEHWNGTVVPSRAYQEGGIHEAIACYEDNVSRRGAVPPGYGLPGNRSGQLRRNHRPDGSVYVGI